MTSDELAMYKQHGYTGFIIRYREAHGGQDPPQQLLDELEDAVECSWHMRLWRFFKFTVDLLT